MADTTALTHAQQRLFDAATAAFAELGFGGTSTRDIATRAERSPAAVYIHHRTKEDLLFAISVRGHEAALACLREAAASDGAPPDRLRRMVAAFSRWHLDHARLGRVVQYEFRMLSPEHQDEVSDLRREFVRIAAALLRDGVDTGDFDIADLDRTAQAVLSLSIDVVRWFDPVHGSGHDAIARQHADLAYRMVRATPA